jgi:hypothetical protein
MIIQQGIIASSIQTLSKIIIDSLTDYATTSYSLCSFSAPEGEIPISWFKFIDIDNDVITNSYSLCSFSVSENQLLSANLGYHFLSAEDTITNSYSLCSFSVSENQLSSINLGYHFLSAEDTITNTLNVSSFSVPTSGLTLTYPLTVTNINTFRTSIYGVSSDAVAVLGNPRFSFTYWEVSNGGSWSIVPTYQTVSGYAFLSGGQSWYDASVGALSARLIVGYQGRSYRTNPVALKPYSSVLDIPNLQLWLDASDSTTLSGGNATTGAFRDSSSNIFTITKNGNVGQGNFSPFFTTGSTYSPTIHGGSGYFDRSSYLSTPSNAAFNFGTGNFTVECWINSNDVSSSTQVGFLQTSDVAGGLKQDYNSGIAIVQGIGAGVGMTGGLAVNIAGTFVGSNTPILTTGTWYHIAVVRNSGVVRIYVNGKVHASGTANGNCFGTNLCVGGYYNTSYLYNGYISNLRVVKGTPLYTSNFTPPTAPLTNISNTSLLLNFTNGVALDGTINNSLALYGGAAIVNAAKKYGTGSFLFNGNGEYIVAPSRPNYRLGFDNFTIECWVKFNNTTTDSDGIADSGSTLTSANANQWFIYRNNNILRFGRHAVADLLTYDTSTLVPNTWYHLAVTRDSDYLSMFINGTRVSSTYYAGWDIDDSNVRIGVVATPFYMKGGIDDFRLTRRVSRYGPSTVLLLNGNGSDNANNNTFLDSSSNNFTITRNGSVTQGSFSPFPLNGATYNPSLHGGSGYFNGVAGNYLSVPANAGFNFSSGTFTVEAQVNFNSLPVQATVFGNYNSINTGWTLNLSNGKIVVNFSGDGPNITGTTSIQTGVWYHIAVSGSPGSYKLFVNGIQEGSTYAGATSLVGGNLGVGALGDRSGYIGANPMSGYISSLRIINGTALYTSNFTPSTAPLTNITDTSLLLNFTNGGVIDSTGKNDVITVGNAKISTSIKKYGTGSMYFDGSGDYLRIPASSDLTLGIADFTIEFWCNFTSTNDSGSVNRRILSHGTNTLDRMQIFINDAAGYGSPIGGIVLYTTSAIGTTIVAVNDGNWHHIAFTRQGGTLYTFVDGALMYSRANTTNFNDSSAPYYFGAYASTTSGFYNGFLDDFRITKGAALYTSNFTPPTSELGLTDLTTVSASPFTPPLEHPTSSSGDSDFNNVSLLLQANEPGTEQLNWKDKSPNGNFAFQTNSLLSPSVSSLGIGLLSAVVFDGTNDFLNLSTPIPLTASNASSFFVYNRQGSSDINISLGNKVSQNISTGLQWSDNRVYALEGYSNAKSNIGPTLMAVTKNPNVLYMGNERLFTFGCSLLTLQNSTVIDNSGNGRTLYSDGNTLPTSSAVTIAGNATRAWTFNGINLVYMDPSNDFVWGTGPYTIEAWVKPTSYNCQSAPPLIFGLVVPGMHWAGEINFLTLNNFSGQVQFYATKTGAPDPNTVSIVAPATAPLNVWTHVAVVREGTGVNQLKLYVNGVLSVSGTDVNDYTDATAAPSIARQSVTVANGFCGSISNVRVVKGKAMYTNNFTPVAPLVTVPRTSPLSKQTDYGTGWGTSNAVVDGVGVYESARHKGAMGEIIYANCTLPEAELQLVGNSLVTKWGI